MPWEVGVDVIWRRKGVGQGLTVTHSGIHSPALTPHFIHQILVRVPIFLVYIYMLTYLFESGSK